MPHLRSALLTVLLVSLLAAQADAQRTKPRRGKPGGVPHTFQFTFKLTPQQASKNVTLKVAIPRTIAGLQTIDKIDYSRKPASQTTKGDGRYAEFQFAELSKPETVTITISARLEHNDYETVRRRRTRGKIPAPSRQYVLPEKYIESKDAEIVAVAKTIRGRTRLDQVRNITTFVTGRLRKEGFDPIDRGAVHALKKGVGDCTEYTDLFVALCRAKGIPARCCEGFLNHIPRGETAKHNWAEVYFDKLGWIAFDPLHVDLRLATLTRQSAHYLKLTGKRNDEEIGNFHLYTYRWGSGKVSGTDTFAVRKGR